VTDSELSLSLRELACSQFITYKFMLLLKQPEPALEMRQKIDERVSIQFKIKTKPSFLN